MATSFLAYWKPSTVDAEIEDGEPVSHAASNQFGRVEAGDVVWLVTVREGRLRLVTAIDVGHVTDQAGAAALVGKQPSDLWDADTHIVAADGTAREIVDRDIQHLASKLRFVSPGGNDRLTLTSDGLVNPQQLQTMRVLTDGSADLLAGVLSTPTVPT